jgi:replicative DNA helicase
MPKIDKNNLGYLGREYQYKLILQVLSDEKFGNSIINILSPSYFDDNYLKIIVLTIKEAFDETEVIPDFDSLMIRLKEKLTSDTDIKFVESTIKKIKEAPLNDYEKTQLIGRKFCKQQELKRAVQSIQKIIENGDLEGYDECETVLKKALEAGEVLHDGESVFDNIDETLSEDFRHPIPTDIPGLDEKIGGGLAKTELGIIVAPSGYGKTTLATKIANSAKNHGYNVLQIVFEDSPKVIKRKHYSCWTGVDLNELSFFKDEVKRIVKEREAEPGSIIIEKMPSDSTTIPHIRQYIKRLLAKGIRLDMIIVDYIDCVVATGKETDLHSSEGKTMRQFETLINDFNLVGWTFVQGSRESFKSEIVEIHQMGGSIKKAQIGHLIITVGKTIEQQDTNRANVTIVKSRMGKAGIVFENILFDNSKIKIDLTDTDGVMTFTERRENKVSKEQQKVSSVLEMVERRRKEKELKKLNEI